MTALSQVSRFNFTKVSVNDVLSKIKSLKPGKSPGHDGIQDKFLKLAGENLACSLSVLFNTGFDSCVFPTSMKWRIYVLCTKNLITFVRMIIVQSIF